MTTPSIQPTDAEALGLEQTMDLIAWPMQCWLNSYWGIKAPFVDRVIHVERC